MARWLSRTETSCCMDLAWSSSRRCRCSCILTICLSASVFMSSSAMPAQNSSSSTSSCPAATPSSPWPPASACPPEASTASAGPCCRTRPPSSVSSGSCRRKHRARTFGKPKCPSSISKSFAASSSQRVLAYSTLCAFKKSYAALNLSGSTPKPSSLAFFRSWSVPVKAMRMCSDTSFDEGGNDVASFPPSACGKVHTFPTNPLMR